MTSLRILFHRLAALFVRHDADADLDEEIRTHLALLTAEYERRGLTPQEAQRAARRAFGGVEPMKEICRATQREAMLQEALELVPGATGSSELRMRFARPLWCS